VITNGTCLKELGDTTGAPRTGSGNTGSSGHQSHQVSVGNVALSHNARCGSCIVSLLSGLLPSSNFWWKGTGCHPNQPSTKPVSPTVSRNSKGWSNLIKKIGGWSRPRGQDSLSWHYVLGESPVQVLVEVAPLSLGSLLRLCIMTVLLTQQPCHSREPEQCQTAAGASSPTCW